MTTAATSSGLSPGRVWSRLIPPCSRSLFPLVSTLATHIGGAGPLMCERPGASGLVGAPLRPHRPSSILEEAGPLGLLAILPEIQPQGAPLSNAAAVPGLQGTP